MRMIFCAGQYGQERIVAVVVDGGEPRYTV